MSHLRESSNGNGTFVRFPGEKSKFFPFIALLSILCGIIVFFLFGFYAREDSVLFGSTEGFAVLSLDESRDDRFIRESLERGGIKGLISESSTEVPVDDFGSLKMIALDSFSDEVEAFDPRDTGYAAKLKTFFVRDGKRFLFLPLDNTSGFVTAKLERQLRRLLGNIPFVVTVLGQKSPFFWYFLLLTMASGAALYFSAAKRLLAYEIPVLLALGWGGPLAFILAALLTGIWELLREPLGELSAARLHERRGFDYAGEGFKGVKERLRPFKINCVLILLFSLLFIGFSIAGEFSAVPLAAGAGSFFLLCFLARGMETARAKKSGHIPFVPVLLLPSKKRTFALFPLLLPFGAMSIAALLLPLVFPSFSPSRKSDFSADSRYFVSSSEYDRYIAFQKSFSYRPLGEAREALNPYAYLRYYLDGDGLIAGSAEGQNTAANGWPGESRRAENQSAETPPFPLEKLMRFLIDYSKSSESVSGGELWPGAKDIEETPGIRSKTFLLSVKGWIQVVIILTASALSLLRPGMLNKRKKTPLFGDKRIAA